MTHYACDKLLIKNEIPSQTTTKARCCCSSQCSQFLRQISIIVSTIWLYCILSLIYCSFNHYCCSEWWWDRFWCTNSNTAWFLAMRELRTFSRREPPVMNFWKKTLSEAMTTASIISTAQYTINDAVIIAKRPISSIIARNESLLVVLVVVVLFGAKLLKRSG